MEDKYEFESTEYRVAAMELKAIAYDIVTSISKRKTEIMKITKAATENKKFLTELDNKNDNLLMLTNQLEELLEALDNLDKEMKKVTFEIKEDSSASTIQSNKELEEKKTLLVDSNPIEQKKRIIIPEEKEDANIDIEPEHHRAIKPMQEEQSNKIVSDISPAPAIATSTQISVAEATTKFTKRKFQKTTKNISKAIMVKPNQLENLRNSRINQEQILVKKEILVPLNETIQNSIKKEMPSIKKELPDDIERKIEDLTVKANIYYNEGEIEKAQELYDQIKALTDQN